MLQVAERTLNEVDVVLWLVEPSTFIGGGEKYIIEQLSKIKTPIILVINKIDTVEEKDILEAIDTYKDVCEFAEIIPVSALKGKNTDDVIDSIYKYLDAREILIKGSLSENRDLCLRRSVHRQGSRWKIFWI